MTRAMVSRPRNNKNPGTKAGVLHDTCRNVYSQYLQGGKSRL